MTRCINAVFLAVVLAFPMTSGRPVTPVSLRGSQWNEPQQLVIHTRMRDNGKDETQIIQIGHEVESLDSESDMIKDHLKRSFSSTPQRTKSDKKDKKFKYDYYDDINSSSLSSKKSKKDSKKDSKKNSKDSKAVPLSTNEETATVEEIIRSRRRQHHIEPNERNASVYKSLPSITQTAMPTISPTTMPSITITPKPTPTIMPTIIPSYYHENEDGSQSNSINLSQGNNDDITGRSADSTRHPLGVFPRPPLNQNYEPSSSNSGVPLAVPPPTLAPMHRNYENSATLSETTDKYRDNDRRNNLNEKNKLCDDNDDQQKNSTEHEFPINPDIEAVEDNNYDPAESDENQPEDITDDELIVDDPVSNLPENEGTNQESTENEVTIEDPAFNDLNDEIIEQEAIEDEVGMNEDEETNETLLPKDQNEEFEEEDTIFDDTTSSDYEVHGDSSSIESKENSSKATWKKVLAGFVPACLFFLCIAIFLYYRESRQRRFRFGGLEKINEKMERIDGTFPLDQTTGSGYSKMNSVKSLQDFDYIESELPRPSKELGLFPHASPSQPTGTFGTMPSRYDSYTEESYDSNAMYESEGEEESGNIYTDNSEDNFADDDDIERDDDDNGEDEDDDFFVYNYDHEVDEMGTEEIDDMNSEESSQSRYIEEEFLSTIDEESYHLSTSGSNGGMAPW